jgi:hypothetical protein
VSQCIDLKNRIIVFQRVVAVVIAEGAFRPTLPGRDFADECKLGTRNQRMAAGSRTERDLFPSDQGGENKFGDVLGKWCYRRQDQSRRPSQKYGGGEWLPERFSDGIVKAAALSDLPVHTGGGLIMEL